MPGHNQRAVREWCGLQLTSMSYAKLYHVSGVSCVDHFVTPLIIQRRVLSAPVAPESVPNLSSVKCDSKNAIWCS